MKKFLSYTAIGCIISTSLILTSCGGSESTKEHSSSQRRTIKKDSTEGLNIAYYIQDSIATKFNFYREVDSMLKSKEREFERQLRAKYESYGQYEARIRQRMEAGEITGYQLDDIQQEAMQKQEAIANFERQRGAELQRESMNYQTALMNKISEAGREYSEDRGIDLLFFYAKGGQITYISDAYDATEDFINFLNKREKEIMSGVEEEMEASGSQKDEATGLGF